MKRDRRGGLRAEASEGNYERPRRKKRKKDDRFCFLSLLVEDGYGTSHERHSDTTMNVYVNPDVMLC